MFKKITMNKILFLASLFLLLCLHAYPQEVKNDEVVCYNPNALNDSSKRSINSAVVGNIGDAKITITYHSPGVRKRVIWGGLVPFGEVWVTGAHNATRLEADKSFIIGNTTIPAGKYALFTIPGKSVWTVIINKKWDQHLANDYEQKDDLVRIKVKPVRQAKSVERLQFYIKKGMADKGTIAFAWEHLKIEFPISMLK